MKSSSGTKPLGEICQILDSKRKPITKRNRNPGPYPYCGATGILDYVDSYIFDEPLVLIGEDGAKWGAGEPTAYRVEGKAWVNNHAHVVRPCAKIILASWLIYYLNAIDLSPFIVGLTVPKLNQGKLRDIPVPVLPLRQQKHIVAILDEAFAGIDTAIANTEKNLANARGLFEGYVNNVMEQSDERWIEGALNDFVESVSTGPFGSLLHKSDYVDQGVPLVNPINIVGMGIEADRKKLICEKTKKRLQQYVLEHGDVVTARRGEIGRCAVVAENQKGWVCGTGCFFIRPSANINPHFLAYLLRSSGYRKELEKNCSGATMLNLSNKALSEFRVVIPELTEQNTIVEKIVGLSFRCQEIESAYYDKIEKLRELKQSLLRKAFSGELTAEKPKARRPWHEHIE